MPSDFQIFDTRAEWEAKNNQVSSALGYQYAGDPVLTTDGRFALQALPEAAALFDGASLQELPAALPPAPTFTAEQWVDAQQFDGKRPTVVLYLKLQLDAAQKSSPKLAAVQAWLDSMIVAGVTNPDEQRSDWPVAPWTFEAASQEALQALSAVAE